MRESSRYRYKSFAQSIPHAMVRDGMGSIRLIAKCKQVDSKVLDKSREHQVLASIDFYTNHPRGRTLLHLRAKADSPFPHSVIGFASWYMGHLVIRHSTYQASLYF